jgi:hypothetical protein
VQLGKLLGVIVGLLTIVITLAIAPSIATANTAVSTSGNLTADMIGMSVVVTFGAPLAILGLLAMGGLFIVGAWKSNTTMNDMLQVVFTAIIVIVGLTFMLNILDYSVALIAAGSGGFETVLYGILPLIVYLSIIGLSGWQTYKGVKRVRGRSRTSAPAGF